MQQPRDIAVASGPAAASSISPPALPMADTRDFMMSLSDYVASTLFESWYAEPIGKTQGKIPDIKTLFDTQCPVCHIVIAVKFVAALQ